MKMKKAKRIISIILALLFCVSAFVMLCSCDETEDKGDAEFYIVYKGTKIELDKSASAVLDKLGEPKRSDNLGDCGGIGVQMKYTYGDITVNTLKEEDGEKIHKISFLNDLVETPKGVTIGTSVEDVKDAYGKPSNETDSKLTYKKSDLELEFSIESGSVKAVNYRRVR